MLGITPAAVCQYTSGKRGCRVELGIDAVRAIQVLAEEMAQAQTVDLRLRMCDICSLVRADSLPCSTLQCLGNAPHGD
jgi:predicted transcriptional regulator